MTRSRKSIIKKLIESYRNPDDDKRITLIQGIFGVGKSEFLNDILNDIQQSEITDAICYFNFNIQHDFIVDYLASFDLILPGTEDDSLTFNFDECAYNKSQLHGLLTKIKDTDKTAFTHILKSLTPYFYSPEDAESSSKDFLSERLNNIIDTKGDRRFLLNNHQVAAESLIVDLMNLFYPITDKYPTQISYLSDIKNPIKIIIIFDNIDKVISTISHWLNNIVFPLFLNGKFSDFVAYNIDKEQKEIKISSFIDFSFIISSRADLNQIADNAFVISCKEDISNIELKSFDYDETLEYLAAKEYNASAVDLIYSYSYGLQFLVDMFLEFDSDELNEVVVDGVYDRFTEKVLDSRNDLEREAIMMSAYFDVFDADALRCNSIIGDESKNLFDYLKYNNDLYCSVGDRLSLREPFKKVFLRSLERNYKSRVIEYRTIAQIYTKVIQQYPKLNTEEISILRSLAYFKCFDPEVSVDLAFDDKSSSAKKFIHNNPDYFRKNQFTMSLLEAHRLFLDEYNKLIDRRKYELKTQLITGIWSEKQKMLLEEMEEIKAQISSLKSELKMYGDDPSKVKKQYDLHQKQFIENENELIKLRKGLESFSASRYLSSLIVNLTAAIMSFIIGYFFPELFSTPNNHSSIVIIQYILYFISIVFLIMGLNFSFKIFQTKRNNKGLVSIMEQIQMIEQEKISQQEKMKSFREISSNWQKGVNEITEQVRVKEIRLKEINIILAESYI